MNHAQTICLINAFLWTWKAAYHSAAKTGEPTEDDRITFWFYVIFIALSLWGAFCEG